MKIAPLLGWFGLVLVATSASADTGTTGLARADLVRLENELGDNIAEAGASFARYDSDAQKMSGLYAKLDEKATALRKASAACLGGCNGAQARALAAATKDMEQTQKASNTQFLQYMNQMQAERRAYNAVSNVLKTKHDTVKNSISNIR